MAIDPVEAKKAAKAAVALAHAKTLTFEEATRQYYAQHNAKWRNRKHAKQFLSSLETYALPKIGRLSVADIDTGAVLKVLEPIWPTKTETASRVRGRIESRPRLGHGAQLPDGRQPRALEGVTSPRCCPLAVKSRRPSTNPHCRSNSSPGSCRSWRSVKALPLAHLSSRS